MEKTKRYPKRLKTIKRIKKRVRIKTTIDEVELGRIVMKTTKKPRKKRI